MAESCVTKVLKWVAEKGSDNLKSLVARMPRASLEKLEKDIRTISKNLQLSNPGLDASEYVDQAMRIKFESTKEELAGQKTKAKLNTLRLAQNRLEAKGLNYDAKAIENAFFVGRGHKGHGVRGGLGATAQSLYTELASTNFLRPLSEIDGEKLLMSRDNQVRAVDQILKQEFTDDSIGKAAKIIDNMNKIVVKRMRQVGIPVRALLGRVTKQYHSPVKLMNPKGFGSEFREYLTSLGHGTGAKLQTYIKETNSAEMQDLRYDFALNRWRNYIKPRLDWNLSLLEVDHTDEKAIDEALANTFQNITQPAGTDFTKLKPIRGSSYAERIAAKPRVFFFKDGESRISYDEEYGAGDLLASIDRDLRSSSNKIALVQKFGPDAEEGYAKIREDIRSANEKRPAALKSLKSMDRIMRYMLGQIDGAPVSSFATLAHNFKSFQVLTKLGLVTLHSLSDVTNMWGTMRYNGASFEDALSETMKTAMSFVGKSSKRVQQDFYDEMHVGIQAHIGHLNRFGDYNGYSGGMAKANAAMMKLNGLQRWDNSLKAGIMGATSRMLGKAAGKSFEELHPRIRRLLDLYGWKPEEWDAWRKHGQNKLEGGKVCLTPDGFLNAPDEAFKNIELSKNELYTKAVTLFEDQYQYVVPTSNLKDLANRAEHMNSSLGVLWSLFMQFKTYSINFTRNILLRNIKGTSGVGESTASMIQTIVGTMAAGYAGSYLVSLLENKTPPPVTGPHATTTWVRGILPAMGFYGDVAGALTSPKEDALLELLGPGFATVNDTREYLVSMGKRAFTSNSHRERKSGALLSYQLAKRNIPFANTPFAIAALNWGIGKAIMDRIQPGSYEEHNRHLEKITGQTPIQP